MMFYMFYAISNKTSGFTGINPFFTNQNRLSLPSNHMLVFPDSYWLVVWNIFYFCIYWE